MSAAIGFLMPETTTVTQTVDAITQFCCHFCGELLGYRRDNSLSLASLVITFKKKHRIKCNCCDRFTVFFVNGTGKQTK